MGDTMNVLPVPGAKSFQQPFKRGTSKKTYIFKKKHTETFRFKGNFLSKVPPFSVKCMSWVLLVFVHLLQRLEVHRNRDGGVGSHHTTHGRNRQSLMVSDSFASKSGKVGEIVGSLSKADMYNN